MELAATLKLSKKIDEKLVIVGMEKVPFERVLGVEIGTVMQQLFESKGVEFRMGRVLKRFIPSDANGKFVGGVELDNGEILSGDLVVIGAGIIPTTNFLEKGTSYLAGDGSIFVDNHLGIIGLQNVYAAGDVARFPYGNGNIRVEHWDVAIDQGRIAARNMLGKNDLIGRMVPFFWTGMFGTSIRYAGNAMVWDEIVFKGNLDEKKFAAYFVHQGQIVAVASIGTDPVAVAVWELMREGKMPSPQVIKENELDFILKFASLEK